MVHLRGTIDRAHERFPRVQIGDPARKLAAGLLKRSRRFSIMHQARGKIG